MPNRASIHSYTRTHRYIHISVKIWRIFCFIPTIKTTTATCNATISERLFVGRDSVDRKYLILIESFYWISIRVGPHCNQFKLMCLCACAACHIDRFFFDFFSASRKFVLVFAALVVVVVAICCFCHWSIIPRLV